MIPKPCIDFRDGMLGFVISGIGVTCGISVGVIDEVERAVVVAVDGLLGAGDRKIFNGICISFVAIRKVYVESIGSGPQTTCVKIDAKTRLTSYGWPRRRIGVHNICTTN